MGPRKAIAALLLISLTCAAPTQTLAQTARIGKLCPIQCNGIAHAAFDDELRKLGWVEGRNLTIERKEAEGRSERLPNLAADLVRSRPDLIVASSTPPARAAQAATSEIPIVFSFVGDPVGVGLVQSLARPGGNATGVTSVVTGAYIAKKLEVIRDLLPGAQRVAVLTNVANETARLRVSLEVPLASQQYGFKAEVIGVRVAEEIPEAVAQAKTLGAEALAVVGDPILNTPSNRVPDLASQAALPAVYDFRDAAQAGGLISYGVDVIAASRRHAHLVDRILRGASPAEIPVEQPTNYELVINLRTAKALGLTVPPTLLARADEVIE